MTSDAEMKHPNKDNIRTVGAKETYKYQGILEGDAFRQVLMK